MNQLWIGIIVLIIVIIIIVIIASANNNNSNSIEVKSSHPQKFKVAERKYGQDGKKGDSKKNQPEIKVIETEKTTNVTNTTANCVPCQNCPYLARRVLIVSV